MIAPTLFAHDAIAITPHDDNDLPTPIRAIYVGTSGDVKLTMPSGAVLIFHDLAAGVVHPLGATRVHDTDTTAANIRGIP